MSSGRMCQGKEGAFVSVAFVCPEVGTAQVGVLLLRVRIDAYPWVDTEVPSQHHMGWCGIVLLGCEPVALC